MNSIPQEQGSPQWYEYRADKLGASDAASVMGYSPWCSRYELWQLKTGRKPPIQENANMRYGKEMERPIREWYQEQVSEWFPAIVVAHPEHERIFASLDGISADKKTILEIKTCGSNIFTDAKIGIIPPYYEWQGYHQMACIPDAECVEFVFYHQNDYARAILPRNDNKIAELMTEELDFLKTYIDGDVPPELTENDYIDLAEAWQEREERCCVAYERFKEAKKEWDAEKKGLIETADDGNGVGRYFMLTRSYPKGGIDYAAMETDGIDVEKYRKPSTVKVTIRRLKEA